MVTDQQAVWFVQLEYRLGWTPKREQRGPRASEAPAQDLVHLHYLLDPQKYMKS